MHRNNLTEAVAEAAQACELCFHNGFEYQINEALQETPALWLSYLEATKHNGVNEGVRTYTAKMFIIDIPQKNIAENPESTWLQMEKNAAKICSLIAEAECVKNISDVEFSATKNSITNRGEIAMQIKMNLHVPYINPKN